MHFHLEHHPAPLPRRIGHADPILLMGSCFTENIGARLRELKFDIVENPHGILFNPASIAASLSDCCLGREYGKDDIFPFNEGWHSWNHHSRFSDPDPEICLRKINNSIARAHAFLQRARWVLVTLGSAFVYGLREEADNRFPGDRIVANCHKLPAARFSRRLLLADELDRLLDMLRVEIGKRNPAAEIIFTVSPVRHLREGFVDNNRSKAALLTAVHRQVEAHDTVHYFPAYELVIDDLRDYRFYAEDLVHPNYAATKYVWEKMVQSCLDEPTRELIRPLQALRTAFLHRPFNPQSQAHARFLADNLQQLRRLQTQYPHIDFGEEERHFNNEVR
jgi:hypothetical protein